MAAVTHMLAAVVSPRIEAPSLMVAPPPWRTPRHDDCLTPRSARCRRHLTVVHRGMTGRAAGTVPDCHDGLPFGLSRARISRISPPTNEPEKSLGSTVMAMTFTSPTCSVSAAVSLRKAGGECRELTPLPGPRLHQLLPPGHQDQPMRAPRAGWWSRMLCDPARALQCKVARIAASRRWKHPPCENHTATTGTQDRSPRSVVAVRRGTGADSQITKRSPDARHR